MNIWRFRMHKNQQVILSLLFYQASHEGRIYSLRKLQKSRRALRVSRPMCLGLYSWQWAIMVSFFPVVTCQGKIKQLLPAATSYAVNITIYGQPREDFSSNQKARKVDTVYQHSKRKTMTHWQSDSSVTTIVAEIVGTHVVYNGLYPPPSTMLILSQINSVAWPEQGRIYCRIKQH